MELLNFLFFLISRKFIVYLFSSLYLSNFVNPIFFGGSSSSSSSSHSRKYFSPSTQSNNDDVIPDYGNNGGSLLPNLDGGYPKHRNKLVDKPAQPPDNGFEQLIHTLNFV